MPSHAKTTNSQSSSTVNCCTSGNATDLESFDAKVQSRAAYRTRYLVITSHDLLLRWFTIVPLKYKIPEGTRQRQIAVHSLVFDEAPCRFDTFALFLQRGLMVSTQGHRPTVNARHRSAVTCISL